MKITSSITLNDSEISLSFIRSSGPGGQNVNKVATAVLLRINIKNSPSLPDNVRTRLLNQLGNKITINGELLIKASRYRTQESNKQDALNRLREIILRATKPIKIRRKTKPTKGSKEKRLNQKKLHAKNKSLRRKDFLS